MFRGKDNFAIYANASIHLALTVLLPLICLMLILTANDFWKAIGLGCLIILVIRGSFEFTRETIVIGERKT